MYTIIGFFAALATTAAAKTVVITAGSGGFVFSPESVTADVGDTLEFHFVGSIHTAVQGDFSTPCSMGSLASTGFDSGPVTSSEVFQVTVESTDPIWFFCATPTHCQGGMVGVVNPPSSGNSLASYKSAAADTSSSSSANKAQGGVVAAAGSSSSLSPSSSSSTTPPKSTPSSTTTPTTTALTSSSSPSASGTGSASSPAASPSTSASGSGASSLSRSATTSPTLSPAPTNVGNSLMETGGKFVWSVVIGLGVFVVLMV